MHTQSHYLVGLQTWFLDPAAALRTIMERLDAYIFGGTGMDMRRITAPRFHFCSWSPVLHLFWKTFLAGYSFSVSIANRVIVGSSSKYLSYLTVHGVWVVVAYFLCSCIACWVVYLAPSLTKHPWFAFHCRATQCLFAIGVPFQLTIVTLYWALLAKTDPQSSELRVWDNIESHGIKFMLIWLDLLSSSLRLPHPQLLITIGAALVYLFVNLGVTLSSSPVYPILPWTTPGSGVIVVGALVLMVAAFLIAQLLARLRDRLALWLNAQHDHGARYPAVFDDDAAHTAKLCECTTCCPPSAAAEPENSLSLLTSSA